MIRHPQPEERLWDIIVIEWRHEELCDSLFQGTVIEPMHIWGKRALVRHHVTLSWTVQTRITQCETFCCQLGLSNGAVFCNLLQQGHSNQTVLTHWLATSFEQQRGVLNIMKLRPKNLMTRNLLTRHYKIFVKTFYWGAKLFAFSNPAGLLKSTTRKRGSSSFFNDTHELQHCYNFCN